MARRNRSKQSAPLAPNVGSTHQSSASSSWRVFCAIEIPTEIRQRMLEHADRLREAVPLVQASWCRMESIHLTLKFFGNVEVEKIAAISKAANEVTRPFSPFKIAVDGTGSFPKHGLPRVLWIGLNDPSGKLADLQKKFDNECEQVGFSAEERTFHPHLTVARLRSLQGSRALADLHKEMKFAAIDFAVTELTVFRSELSSEGSRYTVISTHRLGS